MLIFNLRRVSEGFSQYFNSFDPDTRYQMKIYSVDYNIIGVKNLWGNQCLVLRWKVNIW